MKITRSCLVIALVVAGSACDRGGDTSPATSTTATSTTSTTAISTTTVPTVTSTAPVDPSTTATAPITTTNAPSPTVATTTPPVTTVVDPTTTLPRMTDVRVYFLREEQIVISHRDVQGPAVLRAALTELLEGPTTEEAADGLHTEVPTDTELLGVNLVDGLATVDLSSDAESGGGSLSMTARIAQIVFTATQFANVDEVLFWLDGEPVDVFGGEGIVLDQPVDRSGVDRTFTGGLLFDTPAYGATVRSPFTVTGEGDVFEGQFVIEVWADGVQVGGVAPVTAGAWGDWADFAATITIDGVTGPIEVIVRDEGGCGTDPECAPVVETVLPLVLAA